MYVYVYVCVCETGQSKRYLRLFNMNDYLELKSCTLLLL